MTPRSYLIFGRQELDRIENILEPVIADWELSWFGARGMTPQCTQVAVASETADWWYAKPESGLGLFVRKQPGMIEAIALAAFGDLSRRAGLNPPSSIVSDCVNGIIADLSARVLESLGATVGAKAVRLIDQAPDIGCCAAGSGALQLQLSNSALQLDLLIPGDHPLSMLRAQPSAKSAAASVPLDNPMPMIHKRALKLTALLGQTELDIGSLQSLAIGDVIRFETRIDQPAILVTAEGIHVASGYLGSRGQSKSLQLTS